jgi:4-hydroxy-tetrahydrodipicolinate synthase
LRRFFDEITKSSKNGIVIYNAPASESRYHRLSLRRSPMSPAVIGIKQGDLSPAVIDILASKLRGRIRFVLRVDLAFLGPMAAGFDGISSTNSCALPEIVLKAFRAIERGDARTAGELHRVWYPLRELARQHGQPQTTRRR